MGLRPRQGGPLSLPLDASDLPAFANGQRYVSHGGRERERFSDPDASWGHRSAVSTRKGGGFYGYKIHVAVKHEFGLAPLCVRGLERVQLHADLTMLARLGQALARAREVVSAAA